MRTPLWLLLAVLVAVPARAVQVGIDAPRLEIGAPSAGPGLSFQVDAAGLTRSFEQAKTAYLAELQKIAAIPADQRTFENTIVAMEQADAAFSESGNRIGLLANMAPDEATRKRAQELEQELSRVGIETMGRDDLYRAVQAYAQKNEALSGEDALLLEATLRGFKSAGHGLAPEAKAKLTDLSKQLSKLSNKFGNNINESQGGLDLSVEQLKGLPADMIERLQKEAEAAGRADGKVHVSVDYTDYRPFMKYAEDGELRRQLELQFNNRAADKNLAILPEVLKLRQELSQVRGYSSYPELVLENRMAKTPERVWDFFSRLRPVLVKRGVQELETLLQAKRRHVDPAATRVESWERDFLGQKVIKERFDVDAEKIKEYFPVDRVVPGTMKVYERVLGIKFSEVPGADVWHQEVKLYRIDDAQTGAEIGYIYLDLFPREGKYKHAAAFGVIPGRRLPDGSYRKPVAAMIANLAKPAPGKPALLTHDNVETFFHEFGHLMHQTLTKAKYASFAGTSVKRDFVELPSQMLENFVWEREVLDIISGHHETGEKLPDELFQKMVGARAYMDYGMGLFYLRQMALGMIDMIYNTAIPAQTTELFRQIMESVGLIPVQRGSHPEASFGHLMGYASGYYGYLWSLVFADDAWTRFAKEGLFNPKVGRAWRDEVLAWGGARPEEESLKAFLGRDPSDKAFMDNMEGKKPDTVDDKRNALYVANADALDQLMDIPEVISFTADIRGEQPLWIIEVMPDANAQSVERRIKEIEPALPGRWMIVPGAPVQ